MQNSFFILSKYRVDMRLKLSEYTVSGRKAVVLFLVTIFCWEKLSLTVHNILYICQMFQIFMQQSEWPMMLTSINFSSAIGDILADYFKREQQGFLFKLDELFSVECRKNGQKVYCKQKLYNLSFKSAHLFSIYLHLKESVSHQGKKLTSASIQSQLND